MAAPERSKVALSDCNISGEIKPICFIFCCQRPKAKQSVPIDVLAQECRTHAQYFSPALPLATVLRQPTRQRAGERDSRWPTSPTVYTSRGPRTRAPRRPLDGRARAEVQTAKAPLGALAHDRDRRVASRARLRCVRPRRGTKDEGGRKATAAGERRALAAPPVKKNEKEILGGAREGAPTEKSESDGPPRPGPGP